MHKSSRVPPLFVELSEEHQRTDALSGPHGFVVGGMFLPTRLEMAQQYLHAANVLADTIIRQEQEDVRLANPVLFLYRHAIELALKALLPKESSHHRLATLGADLQTHVRTAYQQDVPTWILERLNQLAAIDPGSMAFRYAEERYGGSREFSSVPGELYVGVLHLRVSMNELFAALAGAAEKMAARPSS
jgi:hypothetical protein